MPTEPNNEPNNEPTLEQMKALTDRRRHEPVKDGEPSSDGQQQGGGSK